MFGILSTLNRLRKSEEGVNPVFLGWAMLRGIALPVSLAMLIVIAISILLIACGSNPTPMPFEFMRDMFTALSPLLTVLFGGWILYTYLYLIVVVVILGTVCGPRAFSISWMQVSELLKRLYDMVLRIWPRTGILVLGFPVAPLNTDPVRIYLRNGPPSHLATGWHPSLHPQTE